MMKKALLLILPVLLWMTQLACFAENPVLYIQDRPYVKPIFEHKNVLYAVADDIFPAVQLNLRVQGRVLCGATPRYKGAICPSNTADSFLYIDGKPITQGVMIHHEKVWIALPTLAKAINYTFQFNPETQIADLFQRAALPPSAVSEGALSSPASPKKPEKKKDAKSEKDEIPVVVQNVSQMQDPRTYEVRVFFDVKNTSDHDVKGVVATLNYLDGYGKSMLTRDFNVGALAPGGVSKKEDYWINTTRIYAITPDIKLDWEGKKKE